MAIQTRALVWGIAGLLIGFGGYVVWHGPASPAPAGVTASTTPQSSVAGQAAATTSGAGAPAAGAPGAPTVVQGAPIKTITHITLAFDGPSFTSSSTYPVLSGTGSNVSAAQVLIEDAAGKGIEAATVAITGGRWSYASTRALAPSSYTAILSAEGLVVKAALTVTQ